MFAERADTVITHVAGHDVNQTVPPKQKWGNFNPWPTPIRNSADASASRGGGPEPMELGTASHRTLTRQEYEKLHTEKACFICRKPGHLARNCPMKKNRRPGNGMSS